MQCLYCGKELALLKRWTGGGQFCSEAHKQSYQEEYNRIGLNRLLQAQPKTGSSKSAQAEEPPAHVAAPVAVEEPAEQTVEETPVQAATVPQVMAGFLVEKPAIRDFMESQPYLEPWQPAMESPFLPQWRCEVLENATLPTAAALPLELRPDFSQNEQPALEANVTPNEFVQTKTKAPAFPPISAAHKLPIAGPVEIILVPIALDCSAAASLSGIRNFQSGTALVDSDLLELAPKETAFPAEEAETPVEVQTVCEPVTEPATTEEAEEIRPVEIFEESQSEEAAELETQRTAVEALARLHEELIEQKEAVDEQPAARVEERATAVVVEEPEEVKDQSARFVAEVPPVAGVPSAPDVPAVIEEGTPKKAGEPVELVVKSFPPPKPNPREGAEALLDAPIFLPRLTGLPLRPKVALATLQGAQASKKVGQRNATPDAKTREGKPADNQAPAPRTAELKSVEVKPAEIKPTQVKAAEVKPTQVKPADVKPDVKVVAKAPVATVKETAKAGTQTEVKVKASTKPAEPSPAVQPVAQAGSTPVLRPGAPSQQIKSQPVAGGKTAPAVSSKASSVFQIPKVSVSPAKPEEKVQTPPAAQQSNAQQSNAQRPFEASARDREAPSFGSMPSNLSLGGGLKPKLAMAAAVVVLAGGAFLIWGGKSHASIPVTSAAVSADRAGPSIMVGEGGWVEGWAGDPIGAHYGRQITIYRPSLKLSDYRIEFQGQIDTKSLGWVFRAADPNNYYAMKLAMVSAGLTPKIALLKYIVVNGHETQVGRVPVEQAVRLDTLYSVRMDVRGPKFITYVQGQQTDIWTDDQLKTGGVGFLNEREERGRIKSVTVSLLNGGKQ
jgi:hypothetical protein